MRPICAILFVTVFFTAAAHAAAEEPTRYLQVINRAHDSVTSLALATAGEGEFQAMPLGSPLRGGGGSATIEVAGDHCLYDIRFMFRNGRALVQRNVDICRDRGLRIRPLPRMAAYRQSVRGGAPVDSGDEK